MNTAKGRTTAGFAGVLMIAALTFSAAPAIAATGAPADGNVDVGAVRIIDRTSESMPLRTTAAKTLQSTGMTPEAYVPIPLPPGVELAAGETVQVNYSDGVITQQAITASCTTSSSVETPYVATGYARSRHSHGLSSGCAGTADVNGILSSYAAPWWHQRKFVTVTVTPGAMVSWSTTKACQNSGTTTWHSENAIGSSDTALSPDVNLACNPG